MIFTPDNARKVLAGEKTVTRRLASENPRSPWWRERCSLVPGRSYAVQAGRTEAIGRIVIRSVSLGPLDVLSPAEVLREGFAGSAGFMVAWLEINGSYDPAALVWRVAFELASEAS